MSVIRQIIRGARWHPEYGSHPGTPVLCGLAVLGAVAGGTVGVLAMLGVFGPLWLVGCWGRGHDMEHE